MSAYTLPRYTLAFVIEVDTGIFLCDGDGGCGALVRCDRLEDHSAFHALLVANRSTLAKMRELEKEPPCL